MLTRGKVLLLTILCLLSLVSIGFASWTITVDNLEEEVLGSIMNENIINTKDCIYLDETKGKNNTGIDWFDYQEIGYLNSQGSAYDDTGHIYTYFNIDLDKCNYYFNKKDSLKVKFTLQYANNYDTSFNIFAAHSNKDGKRKQTSCLYECSLDNNMIDYTSYIDGQSIVAEFILNDILLNYEEGNNSIINLNLDYQFYATTGAYFNKNIYNNLKEYNITFELLIEITECDNGGND